MSLTQECINVLIWECWNEIAKEGKGMDPIRFGNLFLSRIREEQTPVAWRSFDLLSQDYNYIDSGIGRYKGPLFAIPPEAPELLDSYQSLQEDYNELVEALAFAKQKLLESAHPYDEAAHRISETLAKHKASMGEK